MDFQVKATLTKVNTTTGATSTWQFGRLSNGWHGCKSLNTDKKLYFKSAAKMNACLGKFISAYGYSVATPEAPAVTQQLSLAL